VRALLALVLLPLLVAGAAVAQNGTANGTNATAGAPASGPATASVTMVAHVDGDVYYWTQEGSAQHNPTLSFAPGTKVTVTVKNSGDQTHNFAVAPDTKGSAYVSSAADTATYEFTMPDKDTTYYCVPHQGLGMKGVIKAAAAGGEPAEGGSESAPPAQPAPTSFTVVGHDDGGVYYWTLEGQTQRNPTITVQPDSDITVTVKNSGSTPHNFGVGDDKKGSDYVSSPADVATYTFHSGPEGQSVKYFCVPHGGLGMNGVIKFAKTLAPPPAPSGGGGTGGLLGTGSINGPAVDLGQAAGDSKCAGQQVPEATANKEVGGPTLDDYKKRCDEGGVSAEGEARAPSGADYVIPISFGIIAVGVAGVVWVHKFYRP